MSNDQNVNVYLKRLLPEPKEWSVQMEEQAEIERIPIMDPLSMNFLMQQIRLTKPKRILEIGTAIGYSALRMLEASPDALIVTIEKDITRYNEAQENIKRQDKQEHIEVVHGDAKDVMTDLISRGDQYDFIFIDAAKGQYKNYFILGDQLLSSGGVIVSDNVLFRNFVVQPEFASKRHVKMVEKLRDYNEFLANHPDYTTSFVPIGDGIAISLKDLA
jgi:predicted O-methyltransferase YrrM